MIKTEKQRNKRLVQGKKMIKTGKQRDNRLVQGFNVVLWKKVQLCKEWTEPSLLRASVSFSQRWQI
jgi:hypothetical protein